MMSLALTLSYGLLTGATLLGLVRLARGPTVLDRILAFDLIATSVVGLIVLVSVQWRTALYLELILLFSLLGFVGTVAFVFHLHRTLPTRRPAAKPPPAGSAPSSPSRP